MFNKILLPVDLQDKQTAQKALIEASHYLAGDEGELHVMAVLPGLNMPMVAAYFPDDAVEKALHGMKAELHELVKRTVPEVKHCKEHIGEGSPAREIIKVAEKIKADLIIMPSHNYTRVENILIGSVTSKVVERAHCSVMVLRELPVK
ncbi:universal stress protein [Marinobacterium sediminicola]|uniref:Nucleotide-binding universal stress protein, UspA family n=1 Tax=Marinobacterium sediminicola TaxID=518898 RepID=A0ABY1S3Y1_9GAMM|nr:universal stress protein [Marinobacterium sediminicola]ULG69191.1 universal stress protein [Marinobacterium sediminicola]SMR78260.1 Nucleotide-binding universal stress protein, UspA family [Marinobacterium sediminicola]